MFGASMKCIESGERVLGGLVTSYMSCERDGMFPWEECALSRSQLARENGHQRQMREGVRMPDIERSGGGLVLDRQGR